MPSSWHVRHCTICPPKWLRASRSGRRARSAPAPQLNGATRVFLAKGDDEAQNESIGDFRDYIRRAIGKTRPALEIGPGCNPMLSKREGYHVASLDCDDQAGLVKKFAKHASEDTSKIEPIDFVWRDGSFTDLVGNRKFDAVVSSHSVEHAPDFVQFLNDSAFVLKDDGVIYLIAPDKRYCFDYFQPVSDPAKVLADHLEKRTRHSFESFYRHVSMKVIEKGAVAWGQHPVTGIEFVLGDPREALRRATQHTASAAYVDMHENYFTPASFALLVEELRYVGQIDLRIDVLTRARGCEFLVALKKAPPPSVPPLEVFLQTKKALCAAMMAEELERIQFAEAV
jgi:SAM-dependent methyltransferase